MLLCTLQITLISITLIHWMRPHPSPTKKQPAQMGIQQAPPKQKRQSEERSGLYFLETSHSTNPQRQQKCPTQGRTEGLGLLLFAQK
jgi:hypothetical protein